MSSAAPPKPPPKAPKIHDARLHTLTWDGPPSLRLSLIELQHHFSVEGGKLISEVFKAIKPSMVLVESGATAEGKLAASKAQFCGAELVDFIIPPFSSVISEKAGVTPRGYAKMVLGPMLISSGGGQLLAAMQEQALLLNLHPALIHALVAEFNVQISRDREAFTQDVLNIRELLGHAAASFYWFKIQNLSLAGDVIAVFALPLSVVFNAEFKPRFGYDQLELQRFEAEQKEYLTLLSSRQDLPFKEESLIRLMGVKPNFDFVQSIEKLKRSEKEIEIVEQEYEKLMSEKSYLLASLRARALFLSEKGSGGAAKLRASLFDAYTELIDNRLFAFAGLIAESITDYGLEGGSDLVQEAQRGYWETLNSLMQNEEL